MVDFYYIDDYELGLNKIVGIKLNKFFELIKFFDLIVFNFLFFVIWLRCDL